MSGEWWVRPDGLWRPDGVSLADLRLFRACNYAARASDMRARYREWNPTSGPLRADTRLPPESWAKLVTTSPGDMCWGMYLMDPRRWARTVAPILRATLAGEAVPPHPELVYALDLLCAPDRWDEDEIRKRLLRAYWRTSSKVTAAYDVKRALLAVRQARRAERMWVAGVDAARTRYTQRAGMRAAAWVGALCASTNSALLAAWEAARAPVPVDTNNKEAV